MTRVKTIGGSDELVATVQVATLAPGLYAFTRGAHAEPVRDVDGLRVPVVQFAAAPSPGSEVELLEGTKGTDGWLLEPGDAVLLRAAGSAPRVLITTYRAAGQAQGTMPLRLTRLDGPEAAAPANAETQAGVAFEVLLHVATLGDQTMTTQAWAGAGGPSQWIEGFAARPTGGVPAEAIEYRALLLDGRASNWQPGGSFVGTRGQGVPLAGFAARLTTAYASRFTLRYAGLFAQSGASPAASNGAECRSPSPRDPLLALRFELVPNESAARREIAAPVAPKKKIAPPAKKPAARQVKAPVKKKKR
jgi:hypothetical protein